MEALRERVTGIALFAVLAVVFIVGLSASRVLGPKLLFRSTVDDLEMPYTPLENAGMDGGSELLLVYLTSPTCQVCADPRLPEAVGRIKSETLEHSKVDGLNFSAVGVAVDMVPLRGVQHLAGLGSWDEVISGRGWLNTGVMRYVWHDFPGVPSVPQLVILKREIPANPHPIKNIVAEEVLLRWVGLDQILAESGGEIADVLQD